MYVCNEWRELNSKVLTLSILKELLALARANNPNNQKMYSLRWLSMLSVWSKIVIISCYMLLYIESVQ